MNGSLRGLRPPQLCQQLKCVPTALTFIFPNDTPIGIKMCQNKNKTVKTIIFVLHFITIVLLKLYPKLRHMFNTQNIYNT